MIPATAALKSFAQRAKNLGAGVKNSQTARETASRLSKWGVPIGAIAAGSYVIPTAAGAGIDNAFRVDSKKPAESVSKVLTWAIFLIVAGVIIFFFLPKIKTFLK